MSRLLKGHWRRLLVSLGVALLPLSTPVTLLWGGSSPTPVLASSNSNGYLLVEKYGGVFNFGDARFYGSVADVPLNYVLKGIAARPAHDGYWTVAADGGVFAFGQAPFLGSAGSILLNRPVWGMAATPTGKGYWLVASDGGIFAFGDAGFYGSTGSINLQSPVVGMAATPSGKGYWLVAADGGVFGFGDARFFGSAAAVPLEGKIVGMAATSSGKGYWLAAADGGVFSFGDAAALGSVAHLHLNSSISGIAATGALNEAPTVTVRAGQTLTTNSGTATLLGDAADADGRVHAVQASLDGASFSDGPLTCSGCDSSNATWSFAGTLGDGVHHIGIRAVDDDGAASTTSVTTVVVDTMAPSVSVRTGPPDGGSTTSAAPAFAGTATDGGSGVKKVTVAVDGGAATEVPCESCPSAGTVSWSYTLSHSLADGSHIFRFRSIDAAGNVSAATTRTITIDTGAPAAPVVDVFPAVNAAAATSAPFSGTAEANSTVKVSVSDAGNAHNLVGSTTADGSGNWTIGSLDLSGLADGPITVSATTTDAVGNTGPAGAQSGSKDTVAPAAPPVDVFSAVNAAGAASVSFSGTAEPNSTVNVAVSDVGKLHTVTGPAPADGSGNWTVSGLDLSGLADGAITVSAKATDAAGNTGSAGSRWGVKDTAAPAAPTIDLIPTIDISNVLALPVSGTAEPNSTIDLTVADGANPAVTAVTVTDSSGNWLVSGLDLANLANGTLTVSATATDAAGNSSSAGTQLVVKIT